MKRPEKMSIKQMVQFVIFHLGAYPPACVAMALGALATAAETYVNSFLYARLLDSLIAGRLEQATQLVYVLALSLLAVQLTARVCHRIFLHYARPCAHVTQKRTAEKAFSLEYEELEKTETMQSIRRVRQGEIGHGGILEILSNIYEYFTNAIRVVFSCGFFLVLLASTRPQAEGVWLSILSTAGLAVAFGLFLWLNRAVSRRIGEIDLKANLENERSNSLGAYIFNVVAGERSAQHIRMYQMEPYLRSKYHIMAQVSKTFLGVSDQCGRLVGVSRLALEIVAGLTHAYVVLKALGGSISTGQVLMFAGAIISLVDSVSSMMTLGIEINYSNEYLKLYEEFIRRPNMHYDGTLPTEKRNDCRYQLELENVTFRYPGTEQDILKNVSLKFSVGEKLALVGLNGAGKTTLIKLLLRLYEPTGGRITLNGIDIGKYDYGEYMRIFSVVFQDFRLFDFPLDENIAGSASPDEKRVAQVLEQVGLTERVEKMKDGPHTLLGHEVGDGEGLSGGEAQKVAIARALYKDAPFVILDEPTAALDPIAEADIYEHFDTLVGEKTAIYISHRMSSCKFCDRIAVLDGGQIAEIGTHDSLLAQKGLYYRLYEAQAQHYTEQT